MTPNKYPSKYSNGKLVSAAQFITEMICENKAIKDKKDLHYRFWTNKNWAAFYRNQIATANKLLKQYDAKAIIKALKSNKARRIYSLRAPHLLPIIETEQEILLKTEDKSVDYTEKRDIKNTQFRKNVNKKSIISKLREMEDDGS
tara:strand:- start:11993 stop:12427 length:435 start_codon:yes stop_codon:yes gene_type:complete